MSVAGNVLDGIDPDLRLCIDAILGSCKQIASVLKSGQTAKLETSNVFGDEQLQIDVLADQILFRELQDSGAVAVASSEEKPVEKELGGDKFSVAFDPLDGSSVIGTNFSVGTIFGVWPGTRLLNRTGRELVVAGCAVYGPRTTISMAFQDRNSVELLLDATTGVWSKTQEFTHVAQGRLFAPGNLRATQSHEGYEKLVNFWITNKYTLRYTGGMVPDVNQILIKGKGVFCNPSSPLAPAKLRLLYECAPLAFLMERSGGKSSDGEVSLLDVPVTSLDRRVQVCYGSEAEVARFNSLVGPAETSVKQTEPSLATST